MRIIKTQVRVRYAETDQMGVVYHANFLVWMEIGRVEYCRTVGLRYRDMEADGVLLTVVEAQCRYLAPALYDQEVTIKTWLAGAHSRMVRFAYEFEADGNKLAEGETKHVFCDRGRKPRKLPEKYRSFFGIA